MSNAIAAAVIAAAASVMGSVLTFIVGMRSVRRSVATSTGVPLGALLEARLDHLEARLAGMDESLTDVRDRLAFEEGRSWPRRWPPR